MRQPRAHNPATTSVVRIAATVSIPEVLRSLGADPEEVLGEMGYDLTIFNDPEYRISYAIRNRILQHCATRTDCPHFGLLIGQHNGLHTFGLVGLLVKYAPDVGTALRNFVRIVRFTSRAHRSIWRVEGELGDADLACRRTGDGGHRSRRRWRARHPVQHHARTVRSRLETDRGLVRTSHAGRCRPVPPVLPGTVALRRGDLRAVVLRRIPEAPLARHRRRIAPVCSKGRSNRSSDRHRDDFPAQVRSVLHTALMTGQSRPTRSPRSSGCTAAR